MEIIERKDDVKVMCVQASSFPAGIMQAFNSLHSLLPHRMQRTTYGISHGSPSGIIYKAAATELSEGESAEHTFDTFIIRKGKYITKMLLNWHTDPDCIGNTFTEMLKRTDIDPNGACIEEYVNDKDVLCMVRLADA